ncbi:MAG TPA: XdhC/CoxI family protein [Candidatus Acidoferrales bacterium]|nr:XdhC/CoxI family protein [Candidatus Acidoferrales bacterium]
MPEVEPELARRLGRGDEVMLATVIRLDGRPPSRAGAKALFSRASLLAGSLGCSEFDAAGQADASPVLDGGRPTLHTYGHDLGSIEVYLEPYPAAPTLVVGAATPVAAALLRWAPELGFRTVLFESRAEKLRDADWPAATVAGGLDQLEAALGDDLYAVHTDHDAPDVASFLEAVLRRRPRFLGLMGSRRHTGHHLEALERRGLPAEAVAHVRSPVGIDLAASTPNEIALSILAGLVAARRGGGAGWMDTPR